MKSSAAALVADIKDRYARTNADKLAIQKDMVVLRDKHDWTQRRIADETGIPKSTVDRWLQAYDESLPQVGQAKLTPASEQDRSDRAVARRVIAENPEIVAEVLEAARQEDRAEMVNAITDPKTKAGRLISQEVHDQDAATRARRREQERQALIDKALPLPAYMANMVVKINEFSLGLAGMVEDLDQLPEGRGRELIAEAIDGLIRQADRWAEKLAPPKPELRVIEGRATVAS